MKEGKAEKPPPPPPPPLFPRLHVKDRDNGGGGPRPPPRNKMGLYEHLSIPTSFLSSSCNSHSRYPSSSHLHLSPNNPTITSLSPASSSHGGGHGRSVISQFHFRLTPSHSSEKIHSDSSDTVKLSTTTVGYDQKSIRNANLPSVNAAEALTSTAEFSSSQHCDYFKFKDSGGKKLEDRDVVFRVPAEIHSNETLCSSIHQHSIMMERFPTTSTSHSGYSTVLPRSDTPKTEASNCNPSRRLYVASDLQLKGSISNYSMPVHVKNQNINNLKVSKRSMDCTKKPASHLLHREGSDLKHTVASSGRDHHSNLVNALANVHYLNTQLHQEITFGTQKESAACSDGVSNESKKLEKRDNLSVRRDLCPSLPLQDNHRGPNEVESGNGFPQDNACRLFNKVDVDRNEVFEASMEIRTDEVVNLIGQQHFWKARKVIVSQQKAFMRQVFELHRLIEVQKLIAAAPEMLFEDYADAQKASEKVSLLENLHPEIVLKSERTTPKGDPKNKNQSPEHVDVSTAKKHHSLDGTKEVLPRSSCLTQLSCPGQFPGNVPPGAPVSTDDKAGLWSFHTSLGNQWLVPMISPSKGLVYKPYRGFFPPNTSAFMLPIYRGCAPSSLPSFPNLAFGTSAIHPPATTIHAMTHPTFLMPPTYFPSYSVPPALNPANSTRVLQTEQLPNLEFNGSDFPQHQNYDLLKCQGEARSSLFGKLRQSKDSETQVSASSNTSIKIQGSNASEGSDSLPTGSLQSEPQTQSRQVSVIRAVPHNTISATESAARIFQCIQQERQPTIL